MEPDIVLDTVEPVRLAPPVAPAILAVATPAAQPELASDVKANGYTLVMQSRTVLMEQTQQVLASMMGDAPICNVCGHKARRAV